MAYLARRPGNRWELRESHATSKGPRSRTLASFRTLTPKVIAHAQERSRAPLSALELRRLATRAGAPVARSAADQAAATLLAELDAGRGPSPTLRRLLAAVLVDGAREASDSELAAAAWLAATPEQRGETLYDLLLLGDSLPQRRRPDTLTFPRFASRTT